MMVEEKRGEKKEKVKTKAKAKGKNLGKKRRQLGKSLTEFRHQMRSGYLLVPGVSFKWHSFMFLMLFYQSSAQKSHFQDIQLVCDERTDDEHNASKKEERLK